MKKLYNARHKIEFMEESKSRLWFEWFFDNIFEIEHNLSKDLFEFSKEDLLELLENRKSNFSTLTAIKSNVSIYISWAIDKNLKLNKKNAALEITAGDLRKIAKDSDTLHVDTVYEIIRYPKVESYMPKLKNAQDRLLVFLLFLGIRGERATELTNLKFEHVDYNNGVLKLGEVSPERGDIVVGDFCMELFKMTQNERHYDRYMDDSNENNIYSKDSNDLLESDYVFRKSASSKNIDEAKISYQGILRRLKTISNYVGTSLTMKQLEKAGMVYVASKILKSGRELSKDNPTVIRAIFERYGIYTDRSRVSTITMLRREVKKIYQDQS